MFFQFRLWNLFGVIKDCFTSPDMRWVAEAGCDCLIKLHPVSNDLNPLQIYDWSGFTDEANAAQKCITIGFNSPNGCMLTTVSLLCEFH